MSKVTVRRIGGRHVEKEYHVYIGASKAGVVYRGSRGWVYQREGKAHRQWSYFGYDRMADAAAALVSEMGGDHE